MTGVVREAVAPDRSAFDRPSCARRDRAPLALSMRGGTDLSAPSTEYGKIAPMANDLLDRILEEIRERKDASRAAHEESQRLQRALAALDEKRGPGRPPDARRPQRRAGSPPRQRRGAAPGANRDAIRAIVRDRPGATAAELASTTGIARATVSSTVARLAASGALERTSLPSGGFGFRVPRDHADDVLSTGAGAS